jgi:glycerol-3-phosphate dehydrogenase
MNREEMLARVKSHDKTWDFIIIGGGSTGIGCALDAAARGYSVALFEQSDFGKGTSSRSTKLIHGGVRYLAQGNVSLVREALRERGVLLENAPHLVKIQPFIVPVYSAWEKFFYGTGLKIYNLLSGKYGFGRSKILSAEETAKRLPNIRRKDLRGGIVYFDGQFDDARLLINLAQTAAEKGAILLNYARIFDISKDKNGKVSGVNFEDGETGEIFSVKARVVINATGAFCDAVRRMSEPDSKKIIAASQGIHLVFDRKFLPAENALMIPETSDGRVLFAIPWHEKLLIGTTDTPIEKTEIEPEAKKEEIEFILETAKDYLENPPQKADVLSVFTGIRPLVKSENTKNTAALSREHLIEIDGRNLLTITGGKWTTYRRMAEDAVNEALKISDLPGKNCVTENLKIHGAAESLESFGELAIYGSDAEKIQKLIEENPSLGEKLHENFSYTKAEIVWFCRSEMARTVEDALARRTRALFLDARSAIEIAPKVAEIMASELGQTEEWKKQQIRDFNLIAKNYLIEKF